MEDVSFLKKTNISAIYRFDQQVKDIIISASQVALYIFDAKKSKWIKRKVEGACFFYKRKTSPKYGIFILNRLDTTNFIELLNSTMEIQLQEPFILYRNIFKTIVGIWFYDKSECVEMGRVFQQILQELKEKEKNEQEDDDNAEALFKAKFDTPDKLDQKAIETDANSKQKKPSGQPESVRQFFAIASKEATKNQPNSQQSPAQHSNCKKSLASSFQTVVHIEKKQTLPMNQSDYDKNVNVIENNMKSLNLTKASPVAILDGIDQKFLQSPVGGDSQTIEFPELIPPSMLITPLDLTNSVKSFDTQTSSDSKNAKLDLMSKNQMIQAMEYLLKNDAQFVDKLYDAYLKISKN